MQNHGEFAPIVEREGSAIVNSSSFYNFDAPNDGGHPDKHANESAYTAHYAPQNKVALVRLVSVGAWLVSRFDR